MALKTVIFFLILFQMKSFYVYADDIKKDSIPFGFSKGLDTLEGDILIDQDSATKIKKNISSHFYGADTHGFSQLPESNLVTPLNLGLVKMAGSLHGTFNWSLNAYHDQNRIQYTYDTLENRLNYILNNYKTSTMFEVNMLGWQPDISSNGTVSYQNTANAEHAGNVIKKFNNRKKSKIQNIMMGNEPFDSEESHGIHIPSADEYIEKYFEYALAIRSAEEEASGNPNNIKIWGPELSTGWTGWQTNQPPDCFPDYDRPEKIRCAYGDGDFTEFIPYFLHKLNQLEKDTKRNPKKYKLLDYLTIHYYSLFRTNFSDVDSIIRDSLGKQNISGMLESVNLWDKKDYINKFDYASPRKIAPNLINTFKNWISLYYPFAKLGLTEFGIDSVDKINYHPIIRPLYLADLVGRVASAGLDAFINSFLQGGTDSNSWAMIDKKKKTPIYYIYSLYSNYFLGEVLKTSDTFGDLINSYAVAYNENIHLFVVNKDRNPHTTQIKFNGESGNQKICKITLPSWSLSVFLIPKDKLSQIKIMQYGAKEMKIDIY